MPGYYINKIEYCKIHRRESWKDGRICDIARGCRDGINREITPHIY